MSKSGNSDIQIQFHVSNNSDTDFKSNGGGTSSGKITKHIDIIALSETNDVLTANGRSGTWTGLTGNASWQGILPSGQEVNLTLEFNIPFVGGNSGSFSGDAGFNEHFDINPNISMPEGNSANLAATINVKE